MYLLEIKEYSTQECDEKTMSLSALKRRFPALDFPKNGFAMLVFSIPNYRYAIERI